MTTTSTGVVRTYATFAIRWSDGARWSGYDTADEAQAVLGSVRANNAGRDGMVERSTFTVSIPADRLDLYRLGDADVDDTPEHGLSCGCLACRESDRDDALYNDADEARKGL